MLTGYILPALGRRLRRWLRPGALAGLLAVPLALWALGFVPGVAGGDPVVGLCLPADTGFGQAVWAQLETAPVEYRPCTEQEARRQVAAGLWDCAFVLTGTPDDPQFLQLTHPGSLLAAPAREQLAAAVLGQRSGALAAAWLAEARLIPADEESRWAGRLTGQLANRSPMILTVEGGGSLASLGAAGWAGALARLALGILVTARALLTGGSLKSLRQSGWYRRARPLAGRAALEAPLLAESTLYTLALCLLGTLAAARLPGFGPVGRQLAGLGPLCLAVPALALLWAALPAGPDMGALALPWLAVGCVLLCPALLDVTRYAPALTPLSRALPPSWYLLWADGTMPALLPLGAGLLWAAALAVQRLAKR